jgi:hypothetical protein
MGLVAGLLATGASRGEALGLAALAHGEGDVLPLLLEELRARGQEDWTAPRPGMLWSNGEGRVLKAVAMANSDLARTGFLAWGRERTVRWNISFAGLAWLDRLPDGFRPMGFLGLDGTGLVTLADGFVVGGGLDLSDTPLAALPEGLEVGAGLRLVGSGVRTLGAGLVVKGILDVRGCVGWDGRIPEDARVERVRTDSTRSEGLPLTLWRHRHPGGEGR